MMLHPKKPLRQVIPNIDCIKGIPEAVTKLKYGLKD